MVDAPCLTSTSTLRPSFHMSRRFRRVDCFILRTTRFQRNRNERAATLYPDQHDRQRCFLDTVALRRRGRRGDLKLLCGTGLEREMKRQWQRPPSRLTVCYRDCSLRQRLLWGRMWLLTRSSAWRFTRWIGRVPSDFLTQKASDPACVDYLHGRSATRHQHHLGTRCFLMWRASCKEA